MNNLNVATVFKKADALLGKSSYYDIRHPAGSPGGTGGEFAPREGGSGGESARPFSNKIREAKAELDAAIQDKKALLRGGNDPDDPDVIAATRAINAASIKLQNYQNMQRAQEARVSAQRPAPAESYGSEAHEARLAAEARRRTEAERLAAAGQAARTGYTPSGSLGGMERQQEARSSFQQAEQIERGPLRERALNIARRVEANTAASRQVAIRVVQSADAIHNIAVNARGALNSRDFIQMGQHLNQMTAEVRRLKTHAQALPQDAKVAGSQLKAAYRQVKTALANAQKAIRASLKKK